MLRTSTILFVHSLPLSYPTCPQSLWCLHFLSLPIRSHFASGECASEASGSQDAARHCVQKVKLDQRFGPVLVKDGECIRFPGLILPCPTFHFSLPVFLVRLQRPQPVQTAELHMWYVALSQYSVWLHVFGLFLALRHATQTFQWKDDLKSLCFWVLFGDRFFAGSDWRVISHLNVQPKVIFMSLPQYISVSSLLSLSL